MSVPGVKFHQHGVNNGWANWPSNLDPTWLEECKDVVATIVAIALIILNIYVVFYWDDFRDAD
jgi:hypothetical protein